MADVRSLLRSELASRGAAPQKPSTGTRITKKRRIESIDEATTKRLRPDGPETTAENESEHRSTREVSEVSEHDALEDTGPTLLPPPVDDQKASAVQDIAQPSASPGNNAPADEVDEDEWAAFEREVVAPTRTPQLPAAATAAATISAAPISAEELAVQQQRQNEEASRAREADVEGEKEDAARLLEEEFDEMEQLEERVKRLKEKREALRRHGPEQVKEVTNGTAATTKNTESATKQAGYESDEEDEGDEDWDDWRFR
ncbi:hypothetical protein VTN31DRAFT_2568 [Thermomyces dupontii]|uniref:uncharacterized protein n=1 Tax=Talaromyces thermophilus TaxID=28565 RepID=UPI0037434B98